MKKEIQKNLSFVVFVMAVFFAGVVLAEFHSSFLLICISGAVLLASSLYFVFMHGEKEQSASEKTTEILLGDRIAECMRGNEKAEKGVYIAVKKQHEAMESGINALQEKLSELIKAQENAVKTVVLYNKENARQLAVSEREELERLSMELKQSINESFEKVLSSGKNGDDIKDSILLVVDAVKDMTHRLYEELHENGEAMLSELGTTTDSVDEIRGMLKALEDRGISIPTAEIQTLPPAKDPDMALSEESVEVPEAFFDIPSEEAVPEEETEIVTESISEEAYETVPETVPEEEKEIVTESISEEAYETVPETVSEEEHEIATEIIPEEPEEAAQDEKKPEDPFASSGVDLSDPNKTLSADDIAALFAAMGN